MIIFLATPVTPRTSTEPRGIESLLSELETCEAEQQPVEEQSTEADKELALYKSLPKACTKDILEWWKQHQTTFPVLATMAKKYLCVPATSVPSERQFSAAGNIVTAKRNCLKPSKVNQLCFLSANLKKYDMLKKLGEP